MKKISYESIVTGILALVSNITFFLLVPGKPFGLNILQPLDAMEEFSKFTFFLFFILLLIITSIGLSVVAIIFGIKDYREIFRGAYIIGGKTIYLIGAILGIINIIIFITFTLVLYVI